jgi:hypothetical protein
MKTFVQVLIVLSVVYFVGCSNESPKTLNVSESETAAFDGWNAFDEVDALVSKVHHSGSIVTAPSGELLDEIGKDPRKVLVALVVSEGKRGWPGLSKSEQLDAISEARINSAAALENLKQVLRRNSDKAIAEAGHKAEQNGKEARFLREYISGQRDKWTQWMFN